MVCFFSCPSLVVTTTKAERVARARRRRWELRRRWRRWPIVAVLLTGLVISALSLIQPIKAELGARLLERELVARMQAPPDDRADADRWRPWPWANLAPVAELRFPGLGEQRIVADSASGEALAWGVGHMSETAPLGAPGVSVVAGHRDGAFRLLEDVDEGDVVELVTLNGETLRYQVSERRIVDSRVARLPIQHAGPDELVLTTCWPIEALASGPERLLLRASLIGSLPAGTTERAS